ncbi:MAG TPA: CoA pyrophosphatase [Blastocatellia bacterium]|nr:CoA pyrophosphatase [Blastocatellia bacterium]
MGDFQIIRRQLDERLAPSRHIPVEPERIQQAAVSLILRDAQGSAQALIIKRAERPGDHWSGHLALPGGRAQIEDVDLIATAARETYEEVGIDLLDRGEFIGQLEILVPTNARLPRIEIAPFVAVAPPEFTLRLNGEVARAFWVSIADLKREGRSSFFSMPLDGVINKWPAYPSESGPIWGITERILTNFLSLLD